MSIERNRHGISEELSLGGSISAAQVEGGWDEGGKAPVAIDYAEVEPVTGVRRIHFINA